MKTIVIGDLMLDKYVFGIVERVSPESGCPILKQTTCEYQLGGAANVAKQLKRLGANVILFGIIGNDENGKMFYKTYPLENFFEENNAIVQLADFERECHVIGIPFKQIKMEIK